LVRGIYSCLSDSQHYTAPNYVSGNGTPEEPSSTLEIGMYHIYV